ncbi:MAG: 1-acyl-sn-glycerol-3-phosphate acyltransferase [Actinobacteria bacterium]|nr:1-acyl-sn-glycerol-3-phosphate acyltransferase [Actinomycetota bacterium]
MRLPVPPYLVRRLLVAPLVWVFGVWLLLFMFPVGLLVLVLVSFALPPWLKPLRVIGFAVVYLACEVVGLTLLLLTWIASGFGWKLRSPFFQRLHYGVLRGLLETLWVFGRRMFALTIVRAGDMDMDDLDGDGVHDARPRLVLSRHAGPGDSFLLVREILSWTGRRPRIVLKSTLQLDPVIDVLLNRLPVAFIDPDRPEGASEAIAELSRTMGPDDALLIFPEGGNFTEGRRASRIERLRATGHDAAADRAETLERLLAPRPGGVRQVLLEQPGSDVVVVAHTGLEDLVSLRSIWKAIPVQKTLYVGWQHWSAAQLPTEVDALSDWLFDRWEDVDDWIRRMDAMTAHGRLGWNDVPPFHELTPANAPGRVGRRRGSPRR